MSNRLHFSNLDISESKENDADIDGFGTHQLESHPSSFTIRIPNARREIEEICNFVEKKSSFSYLQIKWLEIRLSPINEYNTKGLFDMDFPTIFPKGVVIGCNQA